MKISFCFCLLLFLNCSVSAQLNADFSAVTIQGCTPLTVQFQDNSTGSPSEWFWDFGNGVTSSAKNPSVTYTESGRYTVRLIVRNAAEQAYAQKPGYITVFATPEANFLISAGSSGCAPLQSVFKDSSQLFGDSVKSWFWNFGDGSTSDQQNPVHTFNTTGEFNISLKVETQQGCTSTYIDTAGITVGNKPVADFSASPLTGCASIKRSFVNNSTGNITQLMWDFGDGTLSAEKNPVYHYADTGTFAVKLVASDNGCKDSVTKPNYVHVDGPVAQFVTVIDCADRFTITFRDRSIAEQTRLWNFGDGQTSTDVAPVHTYTLPGMYIIQLAVTGAVCNDTAFDTVYIQTAFPKIAILPDSNAICKNRTLQFSVIDYDSAVSKAFAWNFGDGLVSGFSIRSTIAHAYKTNGTFTPQVYIRDNVFCRDTISLSNSITIKGPTALFDSVGGCSNKEIIFNDKSQADQTAPISQYLWSFGDGITSNAQGTVNYTYSFPGAYKVSLKVTDTNGCADSLYYPVNIFSTPIVDAGNDTLVCAGSSFTLNATGAANYVWKNNGDLSCTNCANPVAKPFQPAVYSVTGTTEGCSASDSLIVNVQTKETITAQPAAYNICGGNSVTLNVTGADSYSWLPANSLNNSSISNPVASPVNTTNYQVIGKDSNNCFEDTAFVKVTVNAPPTVNIKDSIVELMTGTTYNILASASGNANSFEWTPATGLSCSTCLQPTATINSSMIYTLKATNQFGCSSSDSISVIAVCTDKFIYLPNTFSPNNDGMNDYFFPRSNTGITIKSFTIFNRWGQMVFQKKNLTANNFNDGWDGKYKNQLQASDVYVYMMELECSGGKVFVKKGSITLIR